MPHIIVEYTDILAPSLDVAKLLAGLHKNLSERETIKLEAIKTRAFPVQYCVVGTGADHDKMVHINLRLLPGRSDDLKKEMAQGLHDFARKCCVHDERISVTVEVSELHEASYTK
ncbi:MAG: hypothetical protein AAF182_04160 [Pseudomonadota bacterium]